MAVEGSIVGAGSVLTLPAGGAGMVFMLTRYWNVRKPSFEGLRSSSRLPQGYVVYFSLPVIVSKRISEDLWFNQ